MNKTIIVKCSKCGATLSVPEEYSHDKLLHCSQCGQNFENTYKAPTRRNKVNNRIKTKSVKDNKWSPRQRTGCWVAVIIVCVILYFVGSCDGLFKSSNTPHIGDNIVFIKNTLGGIDKDVQDEVGRLVVANDQIGLSQLIMQGKVYPISKGDRGKMIGGSWMLIRIRLSNGNACWVPTGTVKKELADY